MIQMPNDKEGKNNADKNECSASNKCESNYNSGDGNACQNPLIATKDTEYYCLRLIHINLLMGPRTEIKNSHD